MITSSKPITTKDLLTGIAIGDALGSTTEFLDKIRVLDLYRNIKDNGYPFAQYGSPTRKLLPGNWTDDTDMAICIAKGNRDPAQIADNFVDWMLSNPPDIGGTCRRSLQILEREETPFWIGGKTFYNMYPNMVSNGSLMRNGVIAGMSDNLYTLYTLTLEHGMITHYHPLSQLCCMAQTYIECMLMHNKFSWDTWVEDFLESASKYFYDYVVESSIINWLSEVDERKAIADFRSANWDMKTFDPFQEDLRFKTGYTLISLQIAVWGLYHATHNTDFNAMGYPSRIFKASGSDRLGWIAMIGHDSDTYCAICAPMIIAAGLKFSEELSRNVLIGLERIVIGGANMTCRTVQIISALITIGLVCIIIVIMKLFGGGVVCPK
ncbi:MAG: ADP-ribosylglycohydrolase family protein [Candidatus Gracilibacteria bacterium]|nr:ADP-ribosylglycohydrolase family protein [Candidatus Gracilibacteria bacterium]